MTDRRWRRPLRQRRGFTLLELVIAVTILASFLLPMLLILSKAKVRTIQTQQQRQLRDLAQRKLFDHIHYYDTNLQGDFTAEGRPEWTWEVLPPEMVGNGDQVLLEYTIVVYTPQKIERPGGGGTGSGAGDLRGGLGTLGRSSAALSRAGYGGGLEGTGSTFELSVWTFPDEEWFLAEEERALRGLPTELYGDPSYVR